MTRRILGRYEADKLNSLPIGRWHAFAPELASYEAGRERHRVHVAEVVGSPPIVLTIMRDAAILASIEHAASVAELVDVFTQVRTALFWNHPDLPMDPAS